MPKKQPAAAKDTSTKHGLLRQRTTDRERIRDRLRKEEKWQELSAAEWKPLVKECLGLEEEPVRGDRYYVLAHNMIQAERARVKKAATVVGDQAASEDGPNAEDHASAAAEAVDTHKWLNLDTMEFANCPVANTN